MNRIMKTLTAAVLALVSMSRLSPASADEQTVDEALH
jgi:hypothetical protein